MKLLTLEEQECLDALAMAWNRFTALPVLHQWEGQEFMRAIHEAQKIVMARPVLREQHERRPCEFCCKPLIQEDEIAKGYHTECLPF